MRPVPPRHPNPLDRPHSNHGFAVGASLHSRPQDRQGCRILPGQQFGRQGRPGRRPERGDRGAVHQRHRLSGVRVEHDHDCLVGRQWTAGISGEEADQFGGQPSGGKVGRHRGQESPVSNHRARPPRYRPPASAHVLHRSFEGVAQSIKIQQRLGLRATQHQHEHSLLSPPCGLHFAARTWRPRRRAPGRPTSSPTADRATVRSFPVMEWEPCRPHRCPTSCASSSRSRTRP